MTNLSTFLGGRAHVPIANLVLGADAPRPLAMSAFTHLPLGQRIPSSPHAVSCSLPTMRDVRGYEEKDPAVTRHLTSGYPRFVVHPFARELAAHYVATTPLLAHRALWLVTSAGMAAQLADHLNDTPLAGSGVAKIFHRDGLHGVTHLATDSETFSRAKLFLQNIGGFVSSREAEDHLVRLGLITTPYAEVAFVGDAPTEIRQHLRQVLPATTDADLLLAPSGMNAIWAAFRASAALQATRGRTVWLQLGWLYLDSIAILQKFTASPIDYVYIRDVFDLDALARIFAEHGTRIAGIIAEVPTNPLIQTPDLPALAELCQRYGAHLLIDPSVSSLYNVNVLPHADVVVTSLTKYTASEGDLTAGLAAVNPARPDAAELRRRIAKEIEPLYLRDAARLALEIKETSSVLARIHANTAKVAAALAAHADVKDVFWALHPASRKNYQYLATTPDASGGMITFTLKKTGSLAAFYDKLRLPKGPSFGMKTTLICPFMYLAHYDLVTTPAGLAELAASRLDPDLLRLCVGCEDADDIIATLEEALS